MRILFCILLSSSIAYAEPKKVSHENMLELELIGYKVNALLQRQQEIYRTYGMATGDSIDKDGTILKSKVETPKNGAGPARK